MRLGFGWKEGEAGVSGKQSTELSGEQSELGDPVSVRAGRKILKTGTPVCSTDIITEQQRFYYRAD